MKVVYGEQELQRFDRQIAIATEIRLHLQMSVISPSICSVHHLIIFSALLVTVI